MNILRSSLGGVVNSGYEVHAINKPIAEIIDHCQTRTALPVKTGVVTAETARERYFVPDTTLYPSKRVPGESIADGHMDDTEQVARLIVTKPRFFDTLAARLRGEPKQQPSARVRILPEGDSFVKG
jgi:hypothetical protein